ncbi:hypothetical protein [Spiroplasma endosymbiont of Aspidapion aeneum]|uniref:hypothetical protein n=1 Tax=Spiroplasma endosymbiont of Aspidapion aeneum TaxID=3066276 RepID=UPI00313AA6F1
MNSNKIYKDWKFWYKLILGILPFVIELTFMIGQYYQFTRHFIVPEQSKPLTKNYDQRMINILQGYKSNNEHFKIGLYVFTRNFLFLTTLGNAAMGIFYLNSAFNHKNEGRGKIDNANVAYVVMFIPTFVVIFFNISKVFPSEHLYWYTVLSWFFEHFFMATMSTVYIIFFYNKENFIKTNKQKKAVIISCYGLLYGYFIFWIIVGSIIYAFHPNFTIFGFMSPSGFFPYQFLDLVSGDKGAAADIGIKGTIYLQLFITVTVVGVVMYGMDHLYRYAIKKVTKSF